MRFGKGKKEHLFFNCRFANQVWRRIGVVWVSGINITYMFEHAKKSFQGPKFMEVAICALWGIWKCHNKLIFEGKQLTIQAWKAMFKFDLDLVTHRVKDIHKGPLSDWMNNL
jgi:hypothetical protein